MPGYIPDATAVLDFRCLSFTHPQPGSMEKRLGKDVATSISSYLSQCKKCLIQPICYAMHLSVIRLRQELFNF
jgi:hypothetical protein